MGASSETPDITTDPKCYDLANILVPYKMLWVLNLDGACTDTRTEPRYWILPRAPQRNSNSNSNESTTHSNSNSNNNSNTNSNTSNNI